MAAELYDAPPEIVDRLWRLVDAYHPHLSEARIKVEVRDEAPVSNGFTTMAEVDTADDETERAEFDFAVWFALDEWAGMTELQRDAITDHELCHCGWDEQGKPLLINHDIQEFNAIIARYGLWWPSASETRLALHEATSGPNGPERKQTAMSSAYQRPLPGGGHGSTGALQRPLPGGGHGSTGALQMPMPGGGHGSTGAMTDPHLTPGADYHAIDLGNGETLELCPDCYRAVAAAVLADLQAALG